MADSTTGSTKDSGDGAADEADGWAACPGEAGLDLARWLIRRPQRCVLLRVNGDSMRDAGIHHGDLLVVERDRPARSGAIVVARLGGGFTLKRLRRRPPAATAEPASGDWLEAAHPAYPPVHLASAARQQGQAGDDVRLWGVALHRIRQL